MCGGVRVRVRGARGQGAGQGAGAGAGGIARGVAGRIAGGIAGGIAGRIAGGIAGRRGLDRPAKRTACGGAKRRTNSTDTTRVAGGFGQVWPTQAVDLRGVASARVRVEVGGAAN